MPNFIAVAKVADLDDPGRKLVEVDEQLVVLLKVAGEFFALEDVCTHDGGPLSDGPLDDGSIACPRHGAKFDIRTGEALTMPATKPTRVYEVKIDGEQVLIRSSAGDETEAKTQSEEANTGLIAEDTVREALKEVIDPELFVNIVDLGLIYTVDVTPAADDASKCDVKVEMTMTSPACPAGPQLLGGSKDAVGRLEGVNDVEIKLVMEPAWTPDRMTEDAKDQLGIF